MLGNNNTPMRFIKVPAAIAQGCLAAGLMCCWGSRPERGSPALPISVVAVRHFIRQVHLLFFSCLLLILHVAHERQCTSARPEIERKATRQSRLRLAERHLLEPGPSREAPLCLAAIQARNWEPLFAHVEDVTRERQGGGGCLCSK